MIQTRGKAGRVVRLQQAKEVTGRYCESTGITVANTARIGASLAKNGEEGNRMRKLVKERAGHPAAAGALANFRRAKSKVGGAAAVAGKSLAHVAAVIDRAGRAGLSGQGARLQGQAVPVLVRCGAAGVRRADAGGARPAAAWRVEGRAAWRAAAAHRAMSGRRRGARCQRRLLIYVAEGAGNPFTPQVGLVGWVCAWAVAEAQGRWCAGQWPSVGGNTSHAPGLLAGAGGVLLKCLDPRAAMPV